MRERERESGHGVDSAGSFCCVVLFRALLRSFVEINRKMAATETDEKSLPTRPHPHTDDPGDAWHITSIARRASEAGIDQSQALFIGGEEDILAPPAQCRVLAEIGGWTCKTIRGAAHNVPIEQPELWRQAVLEHLDL